MSYLNNSMWDWLVRGQSIDIILNNIFFFARFLKYLVQYHLIFQVVNLPHNKFEKNFIMIYVCDWLVKWQNVVFLAHVNRFKNEALIGGREGWTEKFQTFHLSKYDSIS